MLSSLLPAKAPGRHRWIVNAVLPLTPEQAAAVTGGAELSVDPEKLIALNPVACVDCNLPYTEGHMQPCSEDDQYADISWPSPPTQGAS